MDGPFRSICLVPRTPCREHSLVSNARLEGLRTWVAEIKPRKDPLQAACVFMLKKKKD